MQLNTKQRGILRSPKRPVAHKSWHLSSAPDIHTNIPERVKIHLTNMKGYIDTIEHSFIRRYCTHHIFVVTFFLNPSLSQPGVGFLSPRTSSRPGSSSLVSFNPDIIALAIVQILFLKGEEGKCKKKSDSCISPSFTTRQKPTPKKICQTS